MVRYSQIFKQNQEILKRQQKDSANSTPNQEMVMDVLVEEGEVDEDIKHEGAVDAEDGPA